MAAVIEAVVNVVEDVVDAVGDAVEAVGDFVSDAVEFVGDAVQAVIEDPLPTLLSVAGSFVGIPPPVTMAAVTAARGGDLEDIVLAAGTAYLAPQASSAISSTLSATIGDAIINETVSNIVVDGVSRGLVNGTIAEVRGGDFEDGFAGAFTGSIVNSSVGEFTNEFIKPGIQDMLADSGIDPSTVNTLVREGSRAVSSGLTAELTGRGDFDSAFINSVQNSTINVGTNYTMNAIGDQFRSVEDGLRTVRDERKEEDELISFDDYFSLETNRNTDTTSAGIPDNLVEEVATSGTGTDSGTITETFASPTRGVAGLGVQTGIDNLLASSDAGDLISEMGEEAIELPEFSEEDVPDDVRDLYGDYGVGAPKVPEIASVTSGIPELNIEAIPMGGLTGMSRPTGEPAPQVKEEDIVFSGGRAGIDAPESLVDTAPAPLAAKPFDPYQGLEQTMAGAPTEESAIDIAGQKQGELLPGGLNAMQDIAGKFMPTEKQFDTSKMVTGALNQFVRPAIQQGLTRAIRGTPSRPAVRRPVQRKPAVAPQQTQVARAPVPAQRAPQKIDMSQIRPTAKAPPPKKVDVKTLTPITNVAGLTSILNRGKG